MKKVLTVFGIALASLPAGIIVMLGIIGIDLVRLAARRAARTPHERTRVTRADRREFYRDLELHALDVEANGPRMLCQTDTREN